MGLNRVPKYSLLVLLIAGAALTIYAWLNAVVSLDHARQQQKADRERSELLRELVLGLNRGVQRSEVLRLVKQDFGSGHVIKEEQGRILLDDIVFQFNEKQSLSKVQFLGSADD